MDELNKKELRRLAEAATGGDWEFRLGMVRTLPDSDGYVAVAVAPSVPRNWRGQRDANMEFIAAANPATILSLLDELEACRKDAARYRWLRGRLPGAAYRVAGVIYSEGGQGVDQSIDAAMENPNA